MKRDLKEVFVTFQSYQLKAATQNKNPKLHNDHWSLLMTVQHYIELFYYFDRNRYDERLGVLEQALLAQDRPITEGKCPPPPP